MTPPISTVCLLGLYESLQGDHWRIWPEPSLKEYIDIKQCNISPLVAKWLQSYSTKKWRGVLTLLHLSLKPNHKLAHYLTAFSTNWIKWRMLTGNSKKLKLRDKFWNFCTQQCKVLGKGHNSKCPLKYILVSMIRRLLDDEFRLHHAPNVKTKLQSSYYPENKLNQLSSFCVSDHLFARCFKCIIVTSFQPTKLFSLQKHCGSRASSGCPLLGGYWWVANETPIRGEYIDPLRAWWQYHCSRDTIEKDVHWQETEEWGWNNHLLYCFRGLTVYFL